MGIPFALTSLETEPSSSAVAPISEGEPRGSASDPIVHHGLDGRPPPPPSSFKLGCGGAEHGQLVQHRPPPQTACWSLASRCATCMRHFRQLGPADKGQTATSSVCAGCELAIVHAGLSWPPGGLQASSLHETVTSVSGGPGTRPAMVLSPSPARRSPKATTFVDQQQVGLRRFTQWIMSFIACRWVIQPRFMVWFSPAQELLNCLP
jgi:hypothetical protein